MAVKDEKPGRRQARGRAAAAKEEAKASESPENESGNDMDVEEGEGSPQQGAENEGSDQAEKEASNEPEVKDEGHEGEDKDAEGEDEDADEAVTPGVTAGTDPVDPMLEQLLMKPLFERREKSLKELVEAMDEFSPIIPDAVTDYYLAKSGFKTTDHRIKRLLALATQKFVADITSDAYQFSRIRAQTASAAGGAGRGRAGPGSTSGRTVLTMESLNGVLGDYGINAKAPDFYR